MSKPVRTTSEHGADVEAVFALLSSEAWPQRKGEAFGDGSRVVRREERPDGGVVLVQSRELPAGVPGFLERFLPKDGRAVQTDEWGPARDGARHGTWTVEVPGAPARLGGTMRLEPLPTGCRYVVEGEVTVKVPVVGGKAESFIAGMVEKLAGKEADLLRASL